MKIYFPEDLVKQDMFDCLLCNIAYRRVISPETWEMDELRKICSILKAVPNKTIQKILTESGYDNIHESIIELWLEKNK